MNELELLKTLISVMGMGFAGLIAVIGFFARRLVTTQDEHAKRLGKVENRVTALEARR